jgi:hypothetical protein
MRVVFGSETIKYANALTAERKVCHPSKSTGNSSDFHLLTAFLVSGAVSVRVPPIVGVLLGMATTAAETMMTEWGQRRRKNAQPQKLACDSMFCVGKGGGLNAECPTQELSHSGPRQRRPRPRARARAHTHTHTQLTLPSSPAIVRAATGHTEGTQECFRARNNYANRCQTTAAPTPPPPPPVRARATMRCDTTPEKQSRFCK